MVDMPQMKYTFPGYILLAPVDRIYKYTFMAYKGRSIKSGTPSTDICFSSVHLDKVCAHLSPPDDEEPIKRSTRAYSVSCKQDSLREKN